MLGVEAVARLIDVGQFDGVADPQRSAIRLFLTDQHSEQGGLARAVGTDHADDAALGQLEVETVDQQPVAEALAQLRGFHHQFAQPWPRRDVEFLGFVALLEFLRFQFLEPGDAGLALGVAALGIGAHPFQLRLHRLDMGGFLLLLDFQPLLLLLQPGGVVAFPRNAPAPIQFQNPAGDVVEEIAVVSDGDHGAGIVLEEAFQPGDGLGVEMVGRLVQQQHVGFRQQQPAQRDAPSLAAGEGGDIRFPRRQAQGVGGDVQGAVEVMAIGGLQVSFEVGLFGGQFLEIGLGIGVGRVDLVQPRQRVC